MLAFKSESIKMVKFIYENYCDPSEKITVKVLGFVTNLEVLEFIFNDLGLKHTPQKSFVNDPITSLFYRSYCFGYREVFEYLQTKFSVLEDFLSADKILEFGDLEAFKKKKFSTKDLIRLVLDSQDYLAITLNLGNLAFVEYLVEEFKFTPNSENLIIFALQSNRVDILNYLVEKHNYQISSEAILSVSSLIMNLQVASYLYKKCDNLIENLFKTTDNLLIIYHLIKKGVYEPSLQTLSFAFSCRYQNFKEASELTTNFIKFLIIDHAIQPTTAMVSVVEDKHDHEILEILQPELIGTEGLQIKI